MRHAGPTVPSILIVEDEPSTAESFAQMLALEGFLVNTAGSATAGLAAAIQTPPQAIILDLHLPTCDGVQFLKRLRKLDHHRTTPVAIVTGDYFLDPGTTEALRDLGAIVRYKPMWSKDIVGLAKELTGS
jgi:CheY-like chemotaxis protein